jgi:acyl carrier protein
MMSSGEPDTAVSRDDVLALVMNRVQAVFGLPPDRISSASHFFEDLHADSLDLVEVVESVERALGDRGVEVALADEQLLGIATVQEAADLIADAAGSDAAHAAGSDAAHAAGSDRADS